MGVNRAVPVWAFWDNIRKPDGSPMGGGTAIAYENMARDKNGHFIFRRARLWSDAEKTVLIASSVVDLDANGLPLDPQTGGLLPVYGDNSYLFYFFDAGATLPDPIEEAKLQQTNPGELPTGVTPPIRTAVFGSAQRSPNAALPPTDPR